MRTRRDVLRTVAAGFAVSLAPLPETLRAQESGVLKEGSLAGQNDHAASGSVAILESGGAHYVSFGADFLFDGAPDPKIALGNDGYDPDTILASLTSNSGAQNFEIPGELDPAAYNEVWIWSEQDNQPLALAELN